MEQSQKERLLRRAAQFSDSGSESESSDSEGRRARYKEKKHSSKKRKHHKHSSSKAHKAHKRHKRSDHEKIAELEKRAAAMGAASMLLPGSRLGFGRHSSTLPTSGDAVTLDTSGDANNALYESLYGGDVPRYNRMDPLDLVRVSRRLGVQLAVDGSTGNATADR